ncbi:MAG: LCP family protein [Anaerolineales bacterium]|jgi:LCP family protein required for cell wall assembly
MPLHKRLTPTLLALLLVACNMPAMYAAPAESSIAQVAPIFQVPADATPTPTPFQPLPPTPTYIPTDMPTPPTPVPTPSPTAAMVAEDWGYFPGPSIPVSIGVGPPANPIPQPEGQVNILLLGSDQRLGDYGFRTDTILLLTLNPHDGTANLTSFPRDLYVYIPGWTTQRINTAQAHGGFDTTVMTFQYNFGVRPDYFIMINLWSFVEVIDSLGGVDVEVAVPLGDHRDGRGYFRVPAGTYHMDGETALWYVRSRYTSNDFDRTRRQQEVIEATYRKLLSLDGIKRAPKLFKTYSDSVTTNMTFGDVAPLLPMAAYLTDSSRVNRYYIGPGEVTGWITPGGAQVLLPNREAILSIMRQALNSQ